VSGSNLVESIGLVLPKRGESSSGASAGRIPVCFALALQAARRTFEFSTVTIHNPNPR
jgi:hypothetical protein